MATTTWQKTVLALTAVALALVAAVPARARMCAPGMYCPLYKITLRGFGMALGGCNGNGGCGTFQLTNDTTMQGYGSERTCMRQFGEPCGNIVLIHTDGSMDWSANGSWSGPPS